MLRCFTFRAFWPSAKDPSRNAQLQKAYLGFRSLFIFLLFLPSSFHFQQTRRGRSSFAAAVGCAWAIGPRLLFGRCPLGRFASPCGGCCPPTRDRSNRFSTTSLELGIDRLFSFEQCTHDGRRRPRFSAQSQPAADDVPVELNAADADVERDETSQRHKKPDMHRA